MAMKWKKILVITVAIVYIILSANYNPGIVKADTNIPVGYRNVGETENFVLYYNPEQHFIVVVDKRNNYAWSSPVVLEQYGTDKISKQWQTNMQALFNFSYANIEQNKGQIVQSNCISEETEIIQGTIKNGISLNYNFTKLNISLTIEIWIDKESLNLRVPVDKINENGKWALVSIELLPFFGACAPNKDGYIFFPDGIGSLLYFGQKQKENPTKYSFYVYGTDRVELRNFREPSNFAMLPVYGVKDGDNAFLGIITEGESDARINLSPSGYIVNFNRISPEFIYRRLYSDPRDPRLAKIEKGMIGINREVKYIFLTGDKANYSGMANAYRNYLVENNKIGKSVQQGADIPVSIDLFMGIKEEQILWDKYISVTNFKQAQAILDELMEIGVKNIEVNLIGWQKDGYGAYHLPPEPDRRLGGVSGLKQLADYASENGIRLYLQSNLTDIAKKSRGFTLRKDAVYQGNGLVVTNINRTRYLLNPFSALDKFTKNYRKLEEYNITSINFEFFGRQLYHDYNKSNPSNRQQTAALWSQILEESSKKFGNVATQGGNAYVLEYVSRLFDIPSTDSNYFISDEAVPFYQMVVHGLIPYTSDEPGNLFYDFQRQKLKWVEYGFIPYFKLTYNKSDLLKYTNYNHLFSSYYKDWIGVIEEVYKEFNDRLKPTWGQPILKHEKVMDQVYLVTYQDGSKIYINYRTEPVRVQENTINGLDYLVVSKEGNKR